MMIIAVLAYSLTTGLSAFSFNWISFALLRFLVGVAIGSDGLGWIDFNNYELARTIGVVALALILFEGGLTAGFDEIRWRLFGTTVACGMSLRSPISAIQLHHHSSVLSQKFAT